MISIPGGMRVWLAVGHTDMRRGMNGQALGVERHPKAVVPEDLHETSEDIEIPGMSTRFLDDGRVCLSNNAAERALRGMPSAADHGSSPDPIVAARGPRPCTA
jgi:hypothetical protein